MTFDHPFDGHIYYVWTSFYIAGFLPYFVFAFFSWLPKVIRDYLAESTKL